MKQLDNSGFTILELMIATTILTVLLLLIASTSLQIGKIFFKGVSSSRTQETARTISDQITRNIQYSSNQPNIRPSFTVGSSTLGAICIGSTRYMYRTETPVGNGSHALWADDQGASCNLPTYNEMNNPATNGKELIPSGMRLVCFNIPPPGGTTKFYVLDLSVAIGDNALLTGDCASGKHCVDNSSGGQYCDVAGLKTGVYQWL